MSAPIHSTDFDSQLVVPVLDNVPELNDAYLLGKSTPAFESILERPAKLMLGAMWGQRDHRNTQDGDWAVVEMPWSAWIMGADKTKNTPAWGFSRHPVGKDKEGACVVLGASIGKARKAKAMEYMYAMGIDVDSGARLDDVIAKIEDLGLFCIVYTSFNHYKRGLRLKRDDVLRKLQIKSDPTLAQIKEYLQAYSKSRYEADFIANVKIKDAKLQTKEGVVIDLETPPLEKFRLIFPLEEPVKLIDLAPSQTAALEVWEDKVTGLAVELLGVHFDTSATDPSRLFYTARHPKDAEDWYCAIVQGDPLRFEDVPAYRKASYTAKRDPLNPFELAGGAGGADERPLMALTPSGLELNRWHSTHKSRLMLADLLEAYCPDRIRVAGGEANGHVHVECPFEHEHSKEGGTATMAVNALDSQSGYWSWFCHHDACQGRHKLQFLEEALRQEWFSEDLILDADAGFLLLPEDEELEEQDEGTLESGTADAALPMTLAALYDERLVNDGGFLVEPEENPELYKEYGIKTTGGKDAAGLAYKRMVAVARDQIEKSMRERYDYVVFAGEAKAAIRVAQGKPVEFYSEGALDRLYRNRAVSYFDGDGKLKQLKPAAIFMFDRQRRTYSTTCFEPDPKKAEQAWNTHGAYNLWTGFAVDPVKGDWSLLRAHALNVICGGDRAIFNWFMTYVASLFARPGVKIPSSVAIKGEQGTGKSKFFDWLRAGMGCTAMKVSQGKHVSGAFNGHLDGKLLLVAEEAFWAGDKAAAGAIKDLISAEHLTVEAKFENAVMRPNYLTVVFISNEDWVVPTDGADARRFLVLDVSSAHKEDIAYFKAIDAQMERGGLEAMVYELMHWKPEDVGLTWDCLRAPPKTDSLREQIGMGLSGPLERLVSMIEDGLIEGRTPDGDVFYYALSETEPTFVARTHLSVAMGVNARYGNETHAAVRAIRDVLGATVISDNKRQIDYFGSHTDDGETRHEKKTMGRVRYYTIPPLIELKDVLHRYGRG